MATIHKPSTQLIWVGLAQIKSSANPEEELVIRSLFSCLGIAAYDPEKKVGGVLHTMLPNSSFDPIKASESPSLFVNTGVPLLLNLMYELGAKKDRLIFKIAGGSDIKLENPILNIGERNCQAIKDILQNEGLTYKESLGTNISRSFCLNMKKGEVFIETSEEKKIIL